jgi:RecA-family ATPase
LSANPADDKIHELHRLRPLAVGELFQRPEPKWIIRNVLRERSLAVLFGQTGSGKTFLALDLALAIVRGQRWFGLRVKPGNVVYVAGEGHLLLRLKAYMARTSADEADLNIAS